MPSGEHAPVTESTDEDGALIPPDSALGRAIKAAGGPAGVGKLTAGTAVITVMFWMTNAVIEGQKRMEAAHQTEAQSAHKAAGENSKEITATLNRIAKSNERQTTTLEAILRANERQERVLSGAETPWWVTFWASGTKPKPVAPEPRPIDNH